MNATAMTAADITRRDMRPPNTKNRTRTPRTSQSFFFCDVDNQLFAGRFRLVCGRRLAFDVRGLLVIHGATGRSALGLALRATLGIPRLSIGTQAICVGTNRLARALAARRQRLAIGAKTRLARGRILPARIATLCLLSVRRTAGTTRTTRTTIGARTTRTAITTGAAWSTRTTGTHLVARATRTTRAAISTRATTRTARTTGTTTAPIAIATSAARTTTTWTALVTWRGRQLPADARARHLAATRTIVFFLLFRLAGRLHEAAKATRLVAITTRATRTAGTATATTAAITTAAAAATTAITAAATAIITACTATITTRRRRDAIDHVVELATRDGAMRTRFALEHANETNLIDAITDDVERLEQTRGAIWLNTEGARDRVDRGVRCSRRSRRRFCACLAAAAAAFAGAFAAGFARAFTSAFRGRCSFAFR